MNILVVVKSTATLRMLWPLLRALDARGHRIQIATKEVKTSETHAFAQRLVEACRGASFTKLPYLANGGWSDVATAVRSGLDYLRYLAPRYRDAPKLRGRAEDEVPPGLRRLIRGARRVGGGAGVGATRGVLRAIERSLPPAPRALEFLSAHDPDVLVIAPLVGFGSAQADMLRAARRLGIRSVYPVPSWDNLTNKGLLRDSPDLVLVWNELQATEAVELHGVPRDAVRVTGAPAYDHWFGWQPSRTRADFCREVGLDPDRPFVLYAGSSTFVAPGEAAFFRRWLGAVRGHGGALQGAGVLVRPHPLAVEEWSGQELGDEQVEIWPRAGAFPLGAATREDYFDSIFHSAAVVGINTSALIESAIVGRPVHTVLADEYRATQHGTLHFQHLVDPEFGHLRVAQTLAEHAEQLERSLNEGDREARGERFVRRFVRPHGLEHAATPLAVGAIEELAGRPAPAPVRGPVLGPAVRLALSPLAARAARRRRRSKAERVSEGPLAEVKRRVRELARGRDGTVVAQPWQGGELEELLYWIPFLRWAVTANFELGDRLVATVRPEKAAWYVGLNVAVSPDPGADALEPELIEPHLDELATQDPWAPLHSRLLEFAPLPSGVPGTSAYRGSDVVSAVLAVLGGVDAVYTGPADDRLRLAVALGKPPYGRLEIVSSDERVAAVPAGAA